MSDSHLRYIGANGPLSLRKIQTSFTLVFAPLAPNPAITDCERFVHTATPSGIKNTPYGAFFIPGGDEGIRTLDTVARIPHFQCGALDQLCDVSCVFFYSSTSSAVSTATSAVSTGTSSDAKDASNSASISRNNGSSLPISSDSSPDIATGVSLYD